VPNPETLSTREVLRMVYEEAGHELKMRVAPRWLLSLIGLVNADIREIKEMLYEFEEPYVVSHVKFEAAFGAQPTPLREAIRATVDWYRARAA
jgi:nucleoside-diphosphate-sugar epimerase